MDAIFKTEHAIFNYRTAGIWLHDGHVLVHKDVNDKYHWSLPGGRVRVKEDSEQSLKREFLEELGVDIRIDRLLFSTENFFTYRGSDFHEIAFYHQIASDDLSLFSAEAFHGLEGTRLLYDWVAVNELHTRSLKPDFLADALQKPTDHPRHFIIKE